MVVACAFLSHEFYQEEGRQDEQDSKDECRTDDDYFASVLPLAQLMGSRNR
jgi:hypothetical protein